MPKLIDTMTTDQWKTMRTNAGIEKTPWYQGAGPSVGSKLEAWQTARNDANALRKAVAQANYVYNRKDAARIRKAYKALEELQKALQPMLIKAVAHLPSSEDAAKHMINQVSQMQTEIRQKLPKWAAALLKLEQLKDGEKQQIVKKLFDDFS